MATGIYAIHLSGAIVVQNNKFINNQAITQNRRLIGAGVAIQLVGSTFTIVNSSCNTYIYNEEEFSGKRIFLFLQYW